MDVADGLSHTTCGCKYNVVFILKYRKKALYTALRKRLGDVLKELARHKQSMNEEGHWRPEHVRMLTSIPPNYSEAQVSSTLTARVRSTSRGRSWVARSSWGSTSGRQATSSRLSDTSRRWCLIRIPRSASGWLGQAP